ncbi:hypothetical protein AN478_03880 [Thiohalorhabdus denitrificans]|uniref:Cytochrome b n=1 Tax=Thiohalorhabdus denitrificans TaxID=381306 RepID=A0A0P9C7Y2_9GAMM|nr:cytochrome b/b6 domain-containing protein [Thiohalorhabdus denitrificans]KPV41071.1 hypothetical protein AN478_03880 [Thiohalorhabdus denitrificans]SCY39715.1 Cytochrome b [Thiohalorhabdus denitrificans]
MTSASFGKRRVAVWDGPLRLFHWSLVALIGFGWWSGEQGLDWMDAHMLAGQAVLGLVAFRLLWGLWGSRHARFADFLAGPRRVVAELRGLLRGRPEPHLGHGPAGGWAVMLILLLVGAQAFTGLFASDDILTDGPLVGTLPGDIESFLNSAHYTLFDVLLWVVGLHVAAVVVVYPLLAREDLVRPMITGWKRLASAATGRPERFGWGVVLRGLLLMVACLAAVYGGIAAAG